MSKPVIEARDLGKIYRLGEFGTGTISHDLNRWFHKVRGMEDPLLKIGSNNDRTSGGTQDAVWALQHINFTLYEGDVCGIIGPNGAGKSTLLKILSRITKPSTGEVIVTGRMASLLEVGTGFHPEMTGRENIFMNGAIMGMTRKEIKSKLDDIVEFSGVQRYIDTPVKRYSSGMKVRLGFAVAAHLEPEILVVDEVLAVGDAEFQKKCLGKMQEVSTQQGRTVLFVSHNMSVVSALCQKGILLKQGQMAAIGSIQECIERYFEQVDFSTVHYFRYNPEVEACVLEVALCNANGEPVNMVPFGTGWQIKIKIKVNSALRNLVVSVGILDALNYPLRTVWTPDSEVNEGLYTVVFTERHLIFAAGKYKLVVGLSAGMRNFQYIDKDMHFTVDENGAPEDNAIKVRNQRTGFVVNKMESVITRQLAENEI
jgi:lipopolysaccharide transport system ATP-binding protein